MTVHHCAVWLDHQEARIFKFDGEAVEQTDLHPVAHPDRHHVRREAGAHPDDPKFFHHIAEALRDAERILVVGPSTAKLGLLRHLHTHDKTLEPRVVGVETVDHPTNPQLVAYAREYFKRSDRMTG